MESRILQIGLRLLGIFRMLFSSQDNTNYKKFKIFRIPEFKEFTEIGIAGRARISIILRTWGNLGRWHISRTLKLFRWFGHFRLNFVKFVEIAIISNLCKFFKS